MLKSVPTSVARLMLVAAVSLGSAFADRAYGWDAEVSWVLAGGQAYAAFGSDAITLGDVNGDGFSDIAVGATNWSNGQINEGKVFVYHGSRNGPVLAWSREGGDDLAFFGYCVAPAGDVNGDGYDDALLSAPAQINGGLPTGRVYLYLGSASGLAGTAAWIANGAAADSEYGGSIAGAGDVNGDGFDDIVIGARYQNGAFVGGGRIALHLGGPAGPSAQPAWAREGASDWAEFGASVSSAGDVNGDGYADLIAGAPGHRLNGVAVGAAYVYLGGATGLSNTPFWT